MSPRTATPAVGGFAYSKKRILFDKMWSLMLCRSIIQQHRFLRNRIPTMCNLCLLLILPTPEMPPFHGSASDPDKPRGGSGQVRGRSLSYAAQSSQPSGSKHVKSGPTSAEQAADNLGKSLLSASSMEVQANHNHARIERPNLCPGIIQRPSKPAFTRVHR